MINNIMSSLLPLKRHLFKACPVKSEMCLNCGLLACRAICQVSTPCLLNAIFTKCLGVYELRTYDIVLGKTEQWVHRLVQGLPDRCKLSEPVGVWFTEFGPVNTGTFTPIQWYGLERFLQSSYLNRFRWEYTQRSYFGHVLWF